MRLLISLLCLTIITTGCRPRIPDGPPDKRPVEEEPVEPEAIAAFEAAVELYDSSDGENLDVVERKLRQAVKNDASFGRAWFNLGVLAERRGDLQQARAHYAQAAKASPDLAAPLVNLGVIAAEQGDRTSAREYFRRAVEANEYNPEGQSNLSVFLREDEEYAEAVRHVRLSLAANAENTPAYANLARIYYERGNYDVALLVCLNALKFDDSSPDIHNIAGMVWLKKNDVTEAIRNFERAVEREPDHIPARMNLGSVLLSARNYETAAGHFRHVLERQPDNLEAKVSLAVAHRAMGELQRAAEMYQEVQKEDPQNALVEFNLGVLEQEHLAQNALLGVDAGEAPAEPAAQIDWSIANMKRAMEHYRHAIAHYRAFLQKAPAADEATRTRARKRIDQVEKLLEVTSEQIPALKAQKNQLSPP